MHLACNQPDEGSTPSLSTRGTTKGKRTMIPAIIINDGLTRKQALAAWLAGRSDARRYQVKIASPATLGKILPDGAKSDRWTTAARRKRLIIFGEREVIARCRKTLAAWDRAFLIWKRLDRKGLRCAAYAIPLCTFCYEIKEV